MNKEIINCLCGKIFKKHDFKNHYKKCSLFIKRFKELDMKISFLLDKYLYNKENIFLVRYMFKRYIKQIDKVINLNEREKEIFNIKSGDTSQRNSFEENSSFNINKNISNYQTFDKVLETQIIKKYYLYENILNFFSKIYNNLNLNLNNNNVNNNKNNINNNINININWNKNKNINNNNIINNSKRNIRININKNNKNNFVKEIIEDQKNFYSSFPAPTNFFENKYKKNSIKKSSVYKRHTILFSEGNEIQLKIEKNFYINWRVIGNINSETGYQVVKRFRSLLENENNKLDILILFDLFF